MTRLIVFRETRRDHVVTQFRAIPENVTFGGKIPIEIK